MQGRAVLNESVAGLPYMGAGAASISDDLRSIL
jgi:hypothetical protein